MALLLLPAAALAAPQLAVLPSGKSSYTVQVSGLAGASGMDVVITYDSASLGSPQVSQGSVAGGTLFLANVNVPGRIHFAFVSTHSIPESGTVATVSFSPRGGEGGVTGVTASMVGSGGRQSQIATSFSNQQAADNTSWQQPSGEYSSGGSTSSQSTASVDTAAKSTASTPAGLGTLTLGTPQGETQEKKEAAPLSATSEPTQHATPPPADTLQAQVESQSAEQAPPARPRLTPPRSVLQLFSRYGGERTPQALQALFVPPKDSWVRQDPPLAPSDGRTTVRVTVELPDLPRHSPNFALVGAKAISFRMVGERSWQVELLPTSGVVESTLLMADEGTVEIPITVVPPMPATYGGKLLAPGMARFLSERGTEKAPAGDLNGDGRRDSVDDYIYVGNALLQGEAVQKTGAGRADQAGK